MRRLLAALYSYRTPIVVVSAVALIGTYLVMSSSAASYVASQEAETGTATAPATVSAVTGASGSSAVKFGSSSPSPTPNPNPGASTTPNFKVAIIGDSNISTNSKAVLNIVKNEGAQLMIHVGDFDYSNSPSAFATQLNSVLSPTFPMMATIGNHDTSQVPGYQAELNKRNAAMQCTGTRALRAVCKMNGLVVIEEGIGSVYSRDNATEVAFVRNTLAANAGSLWKVCAWHEQMQKMQVGPKGDSTGWLVWEACREAGAIVFTGHDHSYQRTKTLTSFTNQTVDPSCNTVQVECVGPGRSFHVLSGSGGTGLRPQSLCLPTTPPYGCKGEWAKLYTTSQGGKHGALIVTFNVDGNPKLARGYFKDISGTIVDQFEIRHD